MQYLENIVCVDEDGSTQTVPVTFYEKLIEIASNQALPRVDVYDKNLIMIYASKEEHINQISEQILYRGCPCNKIRKSRVGPIIQFEIQL